MALKRKSKPVPSENFEGASSADYHRIDLNSLKQREIRTVGAEYLMLNKLEFSSKLRTLGFCEIEIQTAIGSIVSKTVYHGSERGTLAFLQNRSELGDLIETDFTKFPLTRMYQISDRLPAKKKQL